MTSADKETRDAIDALAHRLRTRDPGTDDEVFAAEFIAALRGRGWRPTEAQALPAWHRPAGHGTEPTPDYLAALGTQLPAPARLAVTLVTITGAGLCWPALQPKGGRR